MGVKWNSPCNMLGTSEALHKEKLLWISKVIRDHSSLFLTGLTVTGSGKRKCIFQSSTLDCWSCLGVLFLKAQCTAFWWNSRVSLAGHKVLRPRPLHFLGSLLPLGGLNEIQGMCPQCLAAALREALFRTWVSSAQNLITLAILLHSMTESWGTGWETHGWLSRCFCLLGFFFGS